MDSINEFSVLLLNIIFHLFYVFPWEPRNILPWKLKCLLLLFIYYYIYIYTHYFLYINNMCQLLHLYSEPFAILVIFGLVQSQLLAQWNPTSLSQQFGFHRAPAICFLHLWKSPMCLLPVVFLFCSLLISWLITTKYFPCSNDYRWASLVPQSVKYLPAMHESGVRSLGQEASLGKGMATHSSIIV